MIVAVIPARGGSKRLPGKNLRLIGGKSLLQWTIESAMASQRLDRIVVSTEDHAIARETDRIAFASGGPQPVGRRDPVEVLPRPQELAQDTTPMVAVMRHALEALTYPDVLVCLQPTTPFRPTTLIDDVLAQLDKGDSVVTVYAGHPTGEVYVTQRHLLLAGRMLGPRCVDYERPGPVININTEYELVVAERACERAMIHGRPHDARMAADHVLSWPVR